MKKIILALALASFASTGVFADQAVTPAQTGTPTEKMNKKEKHHHKKKKAESTQGKSS